MRQLIIKSFETIIWIVGALIVLAGLIGGVAMIADGQVQGLLLIIFAPLYAILIMGMFFIAIAIFLFFAVNNTPREDLILGGCAILAGAMTPLVVKQIYGSALIDYWPEYGQAGKQDTTIDHLLSHQAGVPGLPDAPRGSAYDWHAMTAALETESPLWPPVFASRWIPLISMSFETDFSIS